MSRTSDGPFDNHVLYQSLSVFAPFHQVPLSPCEKRLLNACDTFVSLFVVSPLVVCHWRGTWDFMDQFPRTFPGLNCMVLGALLHCAFAILREPLHSKYNSFKSPETLSKPSKLKLHILKKIYTYVFSLACIMQW